MNDLKQISTIEISDKYVSTSTITSSKLDCHKNLLEYLQSSFNSNLSVQHNSNESWLR
jgi:hypothetical protein